MDCEQDRMDREDPHVLKTIMASLEFGASKQQLKLKEPAFTATAFDVEKVLGAIGKDFSILCHSKSPTRSKEVFVLQVWPDRWKSYMNMSQDDTVKDGDYYLTVSQVSQTGQYIHICDRICKNPARRENAQVAQCTFLVAQVEYYQSPVFVIFMSKNLSTVTIAYGG